MIKIGFSDGVDWIKDKTLKELSRRFENIEVSDKPDFLIYSIASDEEYLNQNCIRIFYTEENLRPDFNLCDYAAEFANLSFADRYKRIPNYLFYTEDYKRAADKHLLNMSVDDISSKEFCNFVYSNGGGADNSRNIIFDKLSEYKFVSSGGRHRNNVGGPVKDKYEFQKKFKFSIAFENASAPGYTTEKILQAFAAGTIPIYWGNPEIVKEFNPKAFINCHAYDSFDEVVKRVIEIDKDDELFLQYLNEPAFATTPKANPLEEWGDYLEYIIKQGPDKAKRRSTVYWASIYERKKKCQSAFWYIATKHKLIERASHWLYKKRVTKEKKNG